jgi:hypothetical protein
MFPIDFTSIPIIGAILGIAFGFLGLIINFLRYLHDRGRKELKPKKRKAKPAQDAPSGDGIARYPARIEDLGPAADPLRQRAEAVEQHIAARRWREAESDIRAALSLPTTPMQRAALYNALARFRFATGDLEGASDAVQRSQHAADYIADATERDAATALARANLARIAAHKAEHR